MIKTTYRSLHKLVIVILLLGLQSIVAYAQGSATIHTTSSSPYRVVTAGNTSYAVIDGSSTNLTLNFDVNTGHNTPVEVFASSLRVDIANTSTNQSHTLDAYVENGKIKIKPLVLNFSDTRTRTISYQINYSYTATSEEETTTERGSISGTMSIELFATPSISAEKTHFDGVLSGTPVLFGIDYTGGISGGWSFEWSDGTANGATNTFIPKVDTTSDKTVTVKAVNYAPDRSTKWFERTVEFSVPVYPTPAVSSSPTYNYISGQQIDLSIITSGGRSDGWTYNWSEGGSSAPNYSFTANNKGTSPIEKNISVSAINTNDAGQVLYSENKQWTMTIYPEAKAELSGSGRLNLIPGEAITLNVIHSGGENGSWSYNWTVDGRTVSANGDRYTYVAENNGSSPLEHTIAVHVVNKATGVQNTFETTLTKTVTVWPAPTTKSKYEATQAIYSGQSASMGIVTAGGFSSGWKYLWTVIKNGIEVSSEYGESELNVTLQSSKAENTIYKLHATNTADGVEVFSQDFTYDITCYPAPKSSIDISRTTLISGEVTDFRAIVSGGDDNAWNYDWKDNGQSFSSQKDASYTAINNSNTVQTHIITLSAVNTPANIKTSYSNTEVREITVYPAPALVSCSPQSLTIFSGSRIEMSAEISGGNPSGWKYIWKVNGEQLIEGVTSYSTTVTNTGVSAVNYVYTLTATNTCDNIEVFTKDYEFRVTVWPTASAELTGNYPTDVINGETVNMTLGVNGGDQSAWSYVWTVNGSTASTDATFAYTASNVATDGSITADVGIKAINNPANIDNPYEYNASRRFTVWATPSLRLLSGNEQTVFSGTTVNMSIETQGGVSGAWEYTWTYNGATVGSEKSLSLPVTNNGSAPANYIYKVRAVNTCNGHIVFDNSYDYKITVWPIPVSSLKTDLPKNVINGQSVDMDVNVTGGDPAAWTYEWLVNSAPAATTKAYRYTANNPEADGSMEATVEVRLANTPAGIDKAYATTYKHTYTVWATPSVKQRIGASQTVFAGTEVKMGIVMQGGVADGWTYEWEYNGNTIGNEASISIVPEESGTDASVTRTYTLTVVNICEGVETFRQTYNYSVTVWPTPKASLPTTYPVNIINGSEIAMSVDVFGGDPSAWTYNWTVDGTAMVTTKDFVFKAVNNAADGSKSTTVGIKAFNTPTDINMPYSYRNELVYTVWATPSLKDRVEENIKLCNGQSRTLSATMQGGYAPGWTYEWELNGESLSESGSSLDIIGVNNTDVIIVNQYKLTATNILDGNTVFTQTYSFEVTVWPTPKVTMNQSSYPTNILSGDKVEMSFSYLGGDPEAWSSAWYLNGTNLENSTNSYTFIGRNTDTSSMVESNVNLVVDNRPAGALDFSHHFAYEHTFKVWAHPVVSSQEPAEINTYSGQPVVVGIEVAGGQADGWNFSWTRNNTTVVNANEAKLSFNAENEAGSMRSDKYRLTATNKVEGSVRFEQSFTFTVNVYPAPSAQAERTEFDNYYGESVVLGLTVKGGNPNGWSYIWSDGSTSPSIDVAVTDSDNDNYILTREVTVTNSFGNEEWYRNTETYIINAYSRGTIQAVPLSDYEFLGQAITELTTSQKGGYPGGWTYHWTVNGTSETSNGPTLDVAEYNIGREVMRLNYVLVAENHIEGRLGSSNTVTFPTLNVWPTIEMPTEIKVSATQIRQGNTITIEPAPKPASGGYEYIWNYDWKQDGTTISTEESVSLTTSMNVSGQSMSTEKRNYTLRLSNPGPSGSTWADELYTAPEVTVYRRPLTPTSLQRKGNGNTHTMIAMLSCLNDSELQANKYYFVFGYTDAGGEDHVLAPTQQRYVRFDSNIYNDNSNTFWVCSAWYYSDQSYVTSGRRYLDGSVDEDFDASTYDGNAPGRGDISGLDGIVGDGEVFFDGHVFKAHVANAAEAVIEIFNAQGGIVQVFTFDKADEFSENVDTNTLTAGMYVAEIKIGSLRAVRKFIVDYK